MSRKNITGDKKIFETYGKALKEAREKEGYKKQYKFAEAIDVKQSEVSRWETTEMEPLEHNQKKIIQVLNKYITPVNNGWVILDSQEAHEFEKAHNAVDRVEEGLIDYKESGIQEDDPQKLLELAEMLIRTARESMKRKGFSDD